MLTGTWAMKSVDLAWLQKLDRSAALRIVGRGPPHPGRCAGSLCAGAWRRRQRSPPPNMPAWKPHLILGSVLIDGGLSDGETVQRATVTMNGDVAKLSH